MQDSSMLHSKPMGVCPTCGKPVVVRSVRDKHPQYCSRVCAANARYGQRYKGTNSGPLDRPRDLSTKTKWEGGTNGN